MPYISGNDSVGVQGGKRSMKSKSNPLCCYFHSAYVSVRVIQVPKRGLDLSLLDSSTSTANNSRIEAYFPLYTDASLV